MNTSQEQDQEPSEQEAQAIIEEIRKEGTIAAKLRDAEETPLFEAAFDPGEADEFGFFIEDAITPEEAEEAALDFE
jgi:hypothetical protein